MKNILVLVIVLTVITYVAGFFSSKQYIYLSEVFGSMGKNVAAVFFTESIDTEDLQRKYNRAAHNQHKINILIMPGHEPDFGGTEFGSLKEREIVVELAGYLQEFLENNNRYRVSLARNTEQWNPVIENYFNENWQEIQDFRTAHKAQMNRLIEERKVEQYSENVYHNDAPLDAAIRLFGINKWSNENDIDIVLHLHFNDYYRRNAAQPGEYSGLSIYIPEKQYSNARASKEIAESVFERLSTFFPVSNLPAESAGVVEDQELVAVGQSNTLDAASLLIEYGYIYEPHIQNDAVRSAMLKEAALQTYLGLQDFFGGENDTGLPYITSLLPYEFNENLTKGIQDSRAVAALQVALIFQEAYPPKNKTLNECPVSGNFGPCTVDALTEFQKKYGITDEAGILGPESRAKLNGWYDGLLPMKMREEAALLPYYFL